MEDEIARTVIELMNRVSQRLEKELSNCIRSLTEFVMIFDHDMSEDIVHDVLDKYKIKIEVEPRSISLEKLFNTSIELIVCQSIMLHPIVLLKHYSDVKKTIIENA